MTDTPKYPEHEKLRAVQAESQAIGEFIDSLGEAGLVLAEWRGDHLVQSTQRTEDLLAAHFEIDQTRLEAEKQAMLASIRADDEAKTRRKKKGGGK